MPQPGALLPPSNLHLGVSTGHPHLEASGRGGPADTVHTDQLPMQTAGAQRQRAHPEKAGESGQCELKPHGDHSRDDKAGNGQPKSFLPVK